MKLTAEQLDAQGDNRRPCRMCKRLQSNGRCAEIKAYEPNPDLPRRCTWYSPTSDDTDQRSGKERWKMTAPAGHNGWR